MSHPLESNLKYSFKNQELLKLALTHPSLGHEQHKSLPHNERLEFLGDAVLELAISDHLYKTFPDIPEGQLTKIRSNLVNRASLVEMAKALEIGSHLLMGKSELTQGGQGRTSNLANAMEAIIGAIFLDGGYAAAQKFVIPKIEFRLKDLLHHPEPENAKGILQEKLHAVGKQPLYQIVSEKGPAHQKEFHASVEIEGKLFGSGIGTTKKEAEMKAAAQALKKLE